MIKKSKHNRNGTLWIVLLVGAMGGAALTQVVTGGSTMNVPPDQLRTENKPAPDKNSAAISSIKQNDSSMAMEDQVKIKVVIPKYNDKGDLSFSNSIATVPDKENRYLFAINAFLKAAKVTEPKAKAISAVVRGKVLFIEFNEAFATGYGTEDEETLVNGVCRSAGQFSEVNQVQFMFNGKPLETLGSVELSSPLSVTRD